MLNEKINSYIKGEIINLNKNRINKSQIKISKKNNLEKILATKKIKSGAFKGLIFSFLFSINPLLIFLFNYPEHESATILIAFFIVFENPLCLF